MKTLKLFYEIKTQQYFVLYRSAGKELFFKVDQVNPIMLSREIEHAMFLNKHEREKIIEEMEEFSREEIQKLEEGF
ncbi:hypothetical protein IQ37_15200 [Chryseobacterium piperi]|uniref:Uncharacterized protein n=1 Tax=Chryseobacterium piperi TaxID=558152 RepID=A0A086AXH0_9FLAO|nr:hypothetical protein [Chryseobacterium piperi]ASW74699.1 hypothetical protein CJF12_10660 [Chryseobacterium piperi]KFF21384.1 hypothetical protein IQ37_15200 [Chryseobacterium piperi]